MKTFVKKMSAVALLLGVSALVISQPAAASTVVTSTIAGNSCIPMNGEAVIRSQWGMYMYLSQPATVVCPINTDGTPWTELDFTVYGYNRNAQDPLSCTLMTTDLNGNLQSNIVVTLATAQAAEETNGTYRLSSIPDQYANLSITCHLPGAVNSTITGSFVAYSHLTQIVVSKRE